MERQYKFVLWSVRSYLPMHLELLEICIQNRIVLLILLFGFRHLSQNKISYYILIYFK
jgi:hypothetical protein